MYDNQPTPAPDCGKQEVQDVGYAERILNEIRELQDLAERLHSKTYELSGQLRDTAKSEGTAKEPQNFCEHTLRDLKRVRQVLYETLDHMGNV